MASPAKRRLMGCCRRSCQRSLVLALPVCVAVVVNPSLLAQLLFSRPGSQSCIPPEELGLGSALPLRSLTEEEIASFERDGSVILPGMLDELWVSRLRALVTDVFEHPNLWDVLYSRLIANFYCAPATAVGKLLPLLMLPLLLLLQLPPPVTADGPHQTDPAWTDPSLADESHPMCKGSSS